MFSYHYYCPYCGTTQRKSLTECIKCHRNVVLRPSKHGSEYYRDKSMEQYGDYSHWDEYLLEEISDDPLFNYDEYLYEKTEEEINEDVNRFLKKIKENENVPKCPTCGSTNIKSISSLKKATHAYAFGLFSKTAKSQFECSNCHYKW